MVPVFTKVALGMGELRSPMDYLLYVSCAAIPAVIAAIFMKPDFLRYLVIAGATGLIFALVAIDLPQFFAQFSEIMATPGSLSSWVIWFLAFLIPSAGISLLLQLCIGGIKVLMPNK